MNTYMASALILSAAGIALSLYALHRAEEAWRRTGMLRSMLEAALSHQRTIRRLAKVRARPRRRYIVFSYIGSLSDEDRGELEEELVGEYRRVFGERGVELAKPRLVFLDPGNKCGVVRVRHIYVNHLVGVMGLVRRVRNSEVLLVPVRTTGTIRKAREICRQAAGLKNKRS